MAYYHRILLISVTIFFCFLTATSQCTEYILSANGDTLNCIDKKGQKQGKWTNRIEELRGEPGYEEEGVYQDNLKTGYWRVFTLQGDLIGIENYRFGQKSGLQQYFTTFGILVKEESWLAYNPEKPTDTVEVYDADDPNIIRMVEVKLEGSAVPHGIWKLYDPTTGKLIQKDNYILGKLDDGTGTANGMMKKENSNAPEKEPAGKKETNEKPKEKPKPKEVQDFEKKNDGKKKYKIRTGATG